MLGLCSSHSLFASRPGGEQAEEVARQLAVLEHWQHKAVKGVKPNPYYVRQFRVQEQLCRYVVNSCWACLAAKSASHGA